VIWRALYTLALYLALPLIVLRLWWRGRREPGYRRRVGERFGRYKFAPEREVLWVHAVSVGEARASAPLVRALREEFPRHELLLTCATAAGRDALKQLYGESVLTAWLPYDYPGSVRRFLEHFRPRLGVLMETEIWPNLLAACSADGVPVVLASARMSERSALGYRRWTGLARPAFGCLAAVCAQGEVDAARLAALGAKHVSVCGNLKFNVSPDAAQLAAGRAWRTALARPILLLASTREGEEKILLDALGGNASDALVVIVPRHPQRFDEVAALAAKDGFPVGRRSRGDVPRPEDRVYLGDTMGEMAFYYAAADVAVIGGSFLPLGGQNLIEGCAAGTAVVLGPSMFNFSEAARLSLEAGAALQADNAADATRAALALLREPAQRAKMGDAGKKLCEQHRGATQRHLAICRRLLQEKD
jgi:3-deoxy-D-manno-octulosonic-acid transferase